MLPKKPLPRLTKWKVSGKPQKVEPEIAVITPPEVEQERPLKSYNAQTGIAIPVMLNFRCVLLPWIC